MGRFIQTDLSVLLEYFKDLCGCRVGLGDSTIVIHCRDSRSTIVMIIVLFTIVIVVDMIFE